MAKLIQILNSVSLKFQHTFKHFTLIYMLLLAELLITIGDFSMIFVVSELAPTIMTIIAIVDIWRKFLKNNPLKASLACLILSLCGILHSFRFFPYSAKKQSRE